MEVIRRIIASKITSELVGYLYEGKEKDFNALIDSKKAKFYIFPYYRDSLKLSSAILKNDKREIERIMKEYENVDLKSSQREALFLQCFQYYVMKEDNTAATKYYNLIKENNQSGDHSELDITYDVFVKKGYEYLEYCLNRLDDLEGGEKRAYESYIYQMYLNMGDKENSEIFYDRMSNQE
ncbi:MAG: hypothetical protein IJJ00_07155 [Erysipelotrichaceae bacterium]|nr:hypothetical protein [Erysipelotrichaceae bacterium]